MAQSYTQIMKQIESLQSQAEKLRRAEVDGVIERIRQAIEVYSLTPADLGFSGGAAGDKPEAANGGNDGEAQPTKRRRRRGAGKSAAKPARAVKFSNGAGGTWGGLGKRPRWLRDALAEGKTLDEFLVK